MRYLLEVSSRAKPGREAEYDRWYEATHVADILSLDGFHSCERFQRLAADGSAAEFVSLFEVETDEPAALLQHMFEASAAFDLSDALDLSSPRFEFLKPIGSGSSRA